MNNYEKKILTKLFWGINCFLVLYIILAMLFYFQAKTQLQYAQADTIKSITNNDNTGELVEGKSIEQTFITKADAINEMSFMIGTYNRENQGSIILSVSDEKSNKLLFQKVFDISEFIDNSFLD